MIEASGEFAENVRHGLGEAGSAWLESLPAVAEALAERWQVTLGAPFALSFNYVCRATRADGTEAVFKIGPWGAENVQEIRALQVYAGHGSCRLLASDEGQGALLLERVRPGRMLRDIAAADDDEATRIGARLMRRLWRPASEIEDQSGLRPLAEWFRAFERHRAFYGGPGPLPERTLAHAEGITSELLASTSDTVLLHADFHHDNVLSSDRDPWLAIDPKGMLGDPGYEVGPFLINPKPHDGTSKTLALLARRLDILAEELEYDRERLRQWGIAHAVLSACWSAENNGSGWQSTIHLAEQFMRA